MSTYAQAHLLMHDINKRFETVIARNPKYSSIHNEWRVEWARRMGTMQLHNFSFDLTMAELALKDKP